MKNTWLVLLFIFGFALGGALTDMIYTKTMKQINRERRQRSWHLIAATLLHGFARRTLQNSAVSVALCINRGYGRTIIIMKFLVTLDDKQYNELDRMMTEDFASEPHSVHRGAHPERKRNAARKRRASAAW